MTSENDLKIWNIVEWFNTFEIILNADMVLSLPYQKKQL